MPALPAAEIPLMDTAVQPRDAHNGVGAGVGAGTGGGVGIGSGARDGALVGDVVLKGAQNVGIGVGGTGVGGGVVAAHEAVT